MHVLILTDAATRCLLARLNLILVFVCDFKAGNHESIEGLNGRLRLCQMN